MNNLLTGKNFIIMGVANKRSIAWGIAKVLHEAGANLIFTYQGERIKREIDKFLSKENIEPLLVECDVTSDDSIKQAFETIGSHYPVIHGLGHCIAFAKREELGIIDFVETSREGYHLSQDISSYSLIAVSNAVKPLMVEGGSIVTLTYLGGERIVENYNVMGVAKAALDASVRYLANDLGKHNIRVNAISAGPIRTLAAKGIDGFTGILTHIQEKAPLRRTVTQEEVGKTAFYLFSDLASGVTGERIHVDSGFHILGL